MSAQSTSVPARPQASGLRQVSVWANETAPLTTALRLERIAAMGKSIAGHVEFLAGVPDLAGTSAEAKEAAVTAFYERMLVAERQLSRVADALRLG